MSEEQKTEDVPQVPIWSFEEVMASADPMDIESRTIVNGPDEGEKPPEDENTLWQLVLFATVNNDPVGVLLSGPTFQAVRDQLRQVKARQGVQIIKTNDEHPLESALSE